MIAFAALRFTEDENLRDRVYWYLGEGLKEGERVLAPVGPHDRLQRARVERTLLAEAENAPYDIRLMKKVAARDGARVLAAGGVRCVELGGVRYDDRHYTRFGRVLYAEEEPEGEELAAYGVKRTVRTDRPDGETMRRILGAPCVLVTGAGAAEVCSLLLALARREEDAAERARALGLEEKEIEGLRQRLIGPQGRDQ